MDFEAAANRLKSDHANLRSRAMERNANKKLATSSATNKAQKLEQYRKQQLEKKRQLEKINIDKRNYITKFYHSLEMSLIGDVTYLDESSLLNATSIHGLGDKITLPSSFLSKLADQDLLRRNQESGQPLFFRLGIKRDGYSFPSSFSMKSQMESFEVQQTQKIGSTMPTSHRDSVKNDDELDESDEDQETDEQHRQDVEYQSKLYNDELKEKYLSYTYATVIEFTEEEGCIGLPVNIANALLKSNDLKNENQILSKYSTDPSTSHSSGPTSDKDTHDKINMNTDDMMNIDDANDESLEQKTPGHPAYGAFPIPSQAIEISLIQRIPLGTKCTLQPTKQAILNGFYNLNNVKLALEQSLIRTRGSLSIGHLMHCWFRGQKFDLVVKDVQPGYLGVVSCVNTDIEVDIAPLEDTNDDAEVNTVKKEVKNILARDDASWNSTITGSGFKLSETNNSPKALQGSVVRDLGKVHLPPEPNVNNENSITVQIRGGDGGKLSSRRCFDISSTQVKDLFLFAQLENLVSESNLFQLVTRFPRRVFTLDEDGEKTLMEVNLSRQELLLIEKL